VSANHPRMAIGVDVGGTSVKLGAITEAGERLGEGNVPIRPGATVAGVFADVARTLETLVPDAPRRARGIGVGLPGLLVRDEHRIENSPNLTWLIGPDLRAALADATGFAPESIRLENDANVAALGEVWLGAAKGARTALIATLGTGIGGALVFDGELFVGEGLAGEIGHVTVVPDGPPCGCGSRGCLETLASATAARRRALELSLPPERPGDLELLAAAARARAGPERDLMEAIGRDLGHGLGTALCLLDVRTFVLGGGFSAALDVLEPGVRRGLSEWAYGDRVSRVRVERATLGASAGWIGAAHLLALAPVTPLAPVASLANARPHDA